MGFREKIGLKSKSSSANLSAAMNGGGGYGFNSNPQQNMYSIPESGFASAPQQARQNKPRNMGLGGGIPQSTASSFEANRSASSGSAYSYTNGSTAAGFGSSTTSFGTTSTGNTTSSSSYSSGGGNGMFGAGIRNFSGASSKSNSSSKTAQPQQPQYQDPQITAADVRRCTKLLRQMFELHLELWTLTYTHGTDQFRRHQKRLQVEAILVDIHNMVGAWNAMPPSTWTEEEYEEIKWIAQTLADLPLPPY